MVRPGTLILLACLCLPAHAQTNEWNWVGGSSTDYQPGVYGSLGVSAAGNIPRNRWAAANWTDTGGNFWLFGGAAAESSANVAPWELNDLWKFSPSTNEWAWMGGSNVAPPWNGNSYFLGSSCSNACGWPGVYGVLGTPAAANVPGSREHAATWTDSKGNLWLFGGWGTDGSGNWGDLNDLWEFNPQTSQWTWIGGSSTVSLMPDGGYGQAGVYGTLGTPAAANIPSARQGAMSWTDSSGHLWLFGGEGPEASGTWGNGGVGHSNNGNWGELNDLWEFDPSSNEWTWMGGSSTAGSNGGQPGAYGTLGTAAAGNIPGSREDATTWADNSGNIWLFAGYGFDANGVEGALNDLWEFNHSTKQWAWMGGSSTVPCSGCGLSGVYGTLGTAAAGNMPGGRDGASGWTDSGGHLWLFGGQGLDSNNNWSFLNDLWEFNPQTSQWIWMGGNSTGYSIPNTANILAVGGFGQPGVWGTSGVPAVGNIPGGVWYATSWTDSSGNFWLFGGYDFGADGNYGGMNAVWTYPPSLTPSYTATATPVFSPAAGPFTSSQSVTITDATTGSQIYYTTDGVTTPTTGSTRYTGAISVTANETIQAIGVAANYLNSPVVTAAYTISSPTNPVPAISGASPAFAGAGGTAFTLTVNGSGFIPASVVYWGASALTTNFVSANQLTAQVPAADIASAGITAITVQTPTPGGGASNSFQFEVDSASSGSTALQITTVTATVTAGSSVNYGVTLPPAVTGAVVSCLNLPVGASCSYTAGTVTITTSPTTPTGTYQVTVVFNETVSGTDTSWILLPILLLPLVFLRRKLTLRGVWLTACLGLVLAAATAFEIGCGGAVPSSPTHQATSSGVVTLMVK
jgi:N-acetylneuraminic acid mutarotase